MISFEKIEIDVLNAKLSGLGLEMKYLELFFLYIFTRPNNWKYEKSNWFSKWDGKKNLKVK